MAMRRRRGPPSFSRPAAAISAVAFKACDRDMSMLLCPAHNQTSPKRTSSRMMLPPLPAMVTVWGPPACWGGEAGNPFPHGVDNRGGAGSSGPVQSQGDEGFGRPLSVQTRRKRGLLQDHVRAEGVGKAERVGRGSSRRKGCG